MAYPSSASIAKAAIQEIVDLVAVDGLPEDPLEARETLRLLAKSETWIPTHCPETGKPLAGVDIIAHAQSLWPDTIPAGGLSADARDREAALYRAAGAKPPVRR